MLEKLFPARYAAARLRSSPLGPWLDSFVQRLAERGYTQWSRRSNVILAADLGRWMATRGRSVATLDESALEAYVEHRAAQRERRHAAAVLVLTHLRAEGVTPPSPVAAGDVGSHFQRHHRYPGTHPLTRRRFLALASRDAGRAWSTRAGRRARSHLSGEGGGRIRGGPCGSLSRGRSARSVR
jgi:hypothetical protein